MDEEGLFELVDGKLIEKQTGYLSNLTAGMVVGELRAHGAGAVLPEQSFRCFPNDPDRIRRPDVACIIASRAAGISAEGHVTVVPDIAVEVVSPNDLVVELEEKLADYRAAGVKLVWVIDPQSRTVRIQRADHSAAHLDESGVLSGESVLPGFSVAVSEILPPKADR